jgi:hypothetical protein
MHPLPALKAHLPVLMTATAVCLLSACDPYPWDRPKPTTDISNPERHMRPPAAALPLPSNTPGVLSWAVAPHDSGSERTGESDAGSGRRR